MARRNRVDGVPYQFEALYFNAINNISERSEAFASIQIKPYRNKYRYTNLQGKADTGAQGNIMPLRTFKKLYPDKLEDKLKPIIEKSDTKLTAYNNTDIPQYGSITIPCRF